MEPQGSRELLGRKQLLEATMLLQTEVAQAVLQGKQAQPLPATVCSLGQFLPPHETNQRGLFGHAAALIVLGHAIQYQDARDALLRYIPERVRIEEQVAGNDADLAIIMGKLAREKRDAFKVSDITRALAQSDGVHNGRDVLLREWSQLLISTKDDEGWSADLRSGGQVDPYATAMACRALANAGEPVDRSILEYLVSRLDANLHLALRILIIFALVDTNYERTALQHWKQSLEELATDMRRPREYIHRYRLGDRMEPVHIPYQLLALQVASKFESSSWWLRSHVQDHLRYILDSLFGKTGFSYEGLGAPRSARTYAHLFEALTDAAGAIDSSTIVRKFMTISNNAQRALTSGAVRLLVTVLSSVAIVWALVDWVRQPNFSMADIGPNAVWALLASALLWRVYRRGRP